MAGNRGSQDFVVLLVGQHQVLESWLQQAGFCVVTAATGEEALDISRRFVDDIVLIVDSVSGTMPGIELCRQMREQRPGTPILLVADEPPEVPVPDLQVLLRPLLPWDFLDKVGTLLRGRRHKSSYPGKAIYSE